MAGTIGLAGRGGQTVLSSTRLAFAASAGAGGLALGLVTVAAGDVVAGFFGTTLGSVGFAIIAFGALSEATPYRVRVPTAGRQVGESNLDRLGPGTGSMLWGVQLGIGFLTRVNTWAFWLMIAALMMAVPSLVGGALVGATYGLTRGLQPIFTHAAADLDGTRLAGSLLEYDGHLALLAGLSCTLAIVITRIY